MKTDTPFPLTARASLLAAAVTLAAPALAADVRIQGNHKKAQVQGERTAYHLVEKGSRLTATVKGPGDLTVLLHAALKSGGNAAVSLFLDKKKIHFVDLKGPASGALSTGGSAGPLKTEVVKIPAGSHEVAVDAFGGAAVAFKLSKGGGHEETARARKSGKHKQGKAAPAELTAEPIAAPPSEPAAAPLAAVTPAPAPAPAAAPTPAAAPAQAAAPAPEESGLMMGEPPKAAAAPAPAPPPVATAAPAEAQPAPATTPAPPEATSTVEVEKPTGKRSPATYWLAGTAVVLAGAAVGVWALSGSQNSQYVNAVEAKNGSAANPSRGSMLQTANTELTVAEALAGAAAAALAAATIVAW